ncbi:MAG: hypothetical protein M3Z30_10870 [Gemmatimonadota bacterium]|nr:hypothetical protein [Gemmatimonadota bacterium]
MRNSVPSLGALLCTVALLAACAKPDASATDTTAAAATVSAAAPAATPPAPGNIAIGDVAGTWDIVSVPESGDTTPTRLVLTASSDSSAWKEKFANGLTVPVHAMAQGDSILINSGPYSSVRRKGVEVTTAGYVRRQGDQLVGETVAHYKTKGADSVLKLRMTGTRMH